MKRVRASALAGRWAFGLVLAASVPGCRHLLDPIRPPPIEGEIEALFPRGTTLRLENGWEAPQVRPLRSEGIHSIEVDLRAWTARLMSELEEELARRGAAPGGSAARAALRVRVTEVRAPGREAGGGPLLEARLESPSGDLAAAYAADPHAKGFSDAFLSLKRQVVEDPRIREWIQGRQTQERQTRS
ncbi:MAG: hypothetical protein HY721_21665 [Planctomycetes bacterium]|nr:hypothetical protein [Planctomycetota bacterium]